jgi:hypothetical protein
MQLHAAIELSTPFIERFRSSGFVLVEGLDVADNRDLIALGGALGEMEVRRGVGVEDTYVRRVEFLPQFADDTVFDDDTANFKSGHTDGWGRRPPDLVLLCCVRPSAAGGSSRLLHVREIVDALAPRDVATLRRPLFPSGAGRIPILLGTERDPRIQLYIEGCRFYADRLGLPLSAEAASALERLDAVIACLSQRFPIRLAPGQCLVIDNTRCLHGRAGFPRGCRRLLRNVYVARAHHRLLCLDDQPPAVDQHEHRVDRADGQWRVEPQA